MNISPEEIFLNGVDSYLETAREADTKNLHRAPYFTDQVINRIHGTEHLSGATLPWEKTHRDFRFRKGEVTIWAGDSGSGKSLVTSQAVLSFIHQGDRAIIASMEMKPEATLARMVRQATGNNQPSQELIKQFMKRVEGQLWIYDQQGMVTPNTILALAYYIGQELTSYTDSITHYVIDSLMTVGVNGDDYNLQKSFVSELCVVAMEAGIHIHLIAHNRKGDNESRLPDKFSVAGSTDITNRVDNVFQFWRNKTKEKEARKSSPRTEVMEQPDASLICVKQRHAAGEESEPYYKLWFHNKSEQYIAHNVNKTMRLIEL